MEHSLLRKAYNIAILTVFLILLSNVVTSCGDNLSVGGDKNGFRLTDIK